MIDLPSEHLSLVRDILKKHLPECEVLVFGSRVTGRAKQFSDLDIALKGEKILDWNNISDRFQQAIIEQFELLTL